MIVEGRRKCGFGKTWLTRCCLIPSILFSLSREREAALHACLRF
jgi:hypothetical protein